MGTVGLMVEKKKRSPWSQAVSAQVRAERAARDLTQQEVMDLAGFAKSTYLRMESGERVIDADQIARLCNAYGLPVSTFFTRVEDRFATQNGGAFDRLEDEVSDKGRPALDQARREHGVEP